MKKRKLEEYATELEERITAWSPQELTNGTEDAYKTLFLGRLSYDTTEKKLRREFETYGPVEKVSANMFSPPSSCFFSQLVMVQDKEGAPRG